MGQTLSRRGGGVALAAGPSYDRRRGRDRRAAMPARAFPGEAGPGSPSGNATEHASPPLSLLLALACTSVSLARHAAPPVAGPSLRQDIPRPPLRDPLLRALRRGALVWQRGRELWQAAQRHTRQRLAAAQSGLRRTADRAHARATPVIEPVIARLDARVRQPAMWLFLPAQRETLARTMAALSVAIVVLGWTALWWTLAPTPRVQPPAPQKQFTARVVSRALPAAAMQKAEAPSVPADEAHDALALAAEPPLPTAPPVRARHEAERALARASGARDARAPAAEPPQAAAPVPARHKAARATARKAAPPARAPRAGRSHALSAAAY